MIERELCYCFHPSTPRLRITDFFSNNYLMESLPEPTIEEIEDSYLSPDVRVRHNNDGLCLYKKKGTKATVREETTCVIEPTAVEILKSQIKFKVIKTRYSYRGSDFIFSIDVVSYPMKVIIVEIEFDNDKAYYRLSQNYEKLAGFTPNTKNAWEYFNRKIGFAGPPSCGKTTLCRTLTNTLSIDFNVPVEQITEYARTHIARYGVPHWSIQPLLEWGQERRERDAADAVVIVSDSPSFLPYFYTVYNYDEQLNPSSIFLLGKMYKGAMYAAIKYTDLVLLEPKPVKQDGIRVQTDADSKKLFELIETFLVQHNVAYFKTDYTIDINDLISSIYTLNTI